ncbi:MAG: glycosyltransferase family 4 protein [Proteobacteria bacterium]|nr:glycosyltransferase family 4 protein [Pseudomonadota bacterium]
MAVYLDCTNTRRAFHQTGIQRVVRNIVRYSDEAAQRHGVAIVPVYLSNRSFHRAARTPDGELVLAPEPDPATLRDEPLKTLYWHVMCAAARWVPGGRVRKWLVAPAARDGMARVVSRVMHTLHLRRSTLWIKAAEPAVTFRPGDVLVALDLDMDQGMVPAVHHAQAAGARIVCVCYDLIPLSHPEGLPPAFVDAFADWSEGVLAHADDVITISAAVADDVRAHFARGGATLRARSVRAFRLGHETDVVAGAVRAAFAERFLAGDHVPAFVTVGWIDTRKNQKVAIEALRILGERGYDARLVVIGKCGPTTAQVLDWLHRQPDLAARVDVYHDASDAEVDYAYRHCAAVICPSLVEGFGLPLLEALARGAHVFASDIRVFHEVAGASATYFDPRDPRDLAARLAAFLQGRNEPASPQPMARWPGWRDSARQFYDLALGAPAA